MQMNPAKTRARVGLYSMGLKHYWGQFPGLKERLLEYGDFIAAKLEAMGAEVFFYGMVDSPQQGAAAGKYFAEHRVDLLFAHCATYVTSASVLPVHIECKAPVVLLNLQPTARIHYADTTTGEWLAHCGACPVPEIANALHRAGITHHIVNGLLGQNTTPAISLADENTAARPEARKAWREIEEWVRAAGVRHALMGSRFGFLGNTYSGMLDMYSDLTMLQAQAGIHTEILEMCDLDRLMAKVTPAEIAAKRKEIENFFIIEGGDAADPIAQRPTEEQLEWSAHVAAAQFRMVEEYDLDALTYYYHGAEGNRYEQLQGGFIVGHSLLTANGVPCAGEGDTKTCLAMKICDLLGVGGSYCEIVVTDYESGTMLLGHDGPFHLAIASGKPTLRAMRMYHGKRGTGISVEATVRSGNITTLGLTQTIDGRLKLIITEAEATDDPIMTIGNTQTHVRFRKDPDSYMDEWFAEFPTHHFAMSTGHNASIFEKTAALLNICSVTIGK